MQRKKSTFLKIFISIKLVLIVIFLKIPSGYGMDHITGFNDEISSNTARQDDQMKICYFRIEELYAKLELMKAIEHSLDALKKEIENRLQNKQKEIIKWNDTWQDLGQLLPSEQAIYNKQTLIKQQEFDQLLKQSELEFQRKEKELMTKLTKEIERTAESYAIENGFDFVLCHESGGIYYGSNKYDITDVLIKIMNDNHKP